MNLRSLLAELSLFRLDPKYYFEGKLVSDIDQQTLSAIPISFTDDNRKIIADPLCFNAFICISGQKFDGHSWIVASLESNRLPDHLELIILEEQNEATPRILNKYRKNVIVVQNSRAALSLMWSVFHKHPENNFLKLGVTGTNGKTSISWIAREFINNGDPQLPQLRKCLSIGTLGQIGIESWNAGSLTSPSPDLFFKALNQFCKEGYDCLSTEVSSHALSQSRYFPTQFQVALFSSFSRDHLDFHETMTSYLLEKLRIFKEMLAPDGVAVIHESILFLEPDLVAKVKDVVKTLKKLVIYGHASSLARVKERSLEWEFQPHFCAFVKAEPPDLAMKCIDPSNRALIEIYKNFKLQETIEASPPGFGEIYAQNYLGAAVAVNLLLGESFINLTKKLVKPVPGRFQPISHSGRLFIIDYAHTPEGLEIALKFCQSLRDSRSRSGNIGKVWCVFGCGGDRDKGKRPLMGKVASFGADRLIVTSDNPRSEDPVQIANEIILGVPGGFNSISTIIDRKEAIRFSVQGAKSGDIILIAGKGHESTQEILGHKYKFSDLEVLQGELG